MERRPCQLRVRRELAREATVDRRAGGRVHRSVRPGGHRCRLDLAWSGGQRLTGDENAPIVVWLDETRLPAVEAWKAAHPEQADLVTAEVVDILQIPAKIALANNAGKGWPDVVFNGANLIAMTATERNDWALDLAPYVSAGRCSTSSRSTSSPSASARMAGSSASRTTSPRA